MTEKGDAGHRQGEDVDYAEPPQIVFAQPAPCSDAGRAEELLRRTLAPSRAPRAAWNVTLRFAKDATGLRAEGEITDEHGAPVAHRVFSRATPECAALARAVGVWASLVLDAEVDKAKDAPPPPAPAPVKLGAPEPLVPWPAPAPHEKPSPEAFPLLKHDAGSRSLEIGVASFLMGGTGTGVLAGPQVFTVFEVGNGVFLRPTVAFGRTMESLKPTGDVYGTWGVTRFDTCIRVPGLYMDRRGMQLDLCGGADIGFLHFDHSGSTSSFADGTPPQSAARTIPFLALGPTLGLRGELAGDLSVEIRGVGGLNVVRESFYDPAFGARVDPPLFNARVELALAWRVR